MVKQGTVNSKSLGSSPSSSDLNSNFLIIYYVRTYSGIAKGIY